MARVVLHIGTHKTATTTIQDMFAHNADLLARHGLIYPRIGKATGHHGLTMDWNHALPPVYSLYRGSIGTLRRVAEKHADSDSTVFLSSEEFSRGSPEGRVDFTAIRQALAPFDRIEVVCVLREQWQFIQSVYHEVSRRMIPPRPPALLAAVLSDNILDGLWTDYNLLYDHLLQALSPDEITFLDFDRCRKAPGGIIGAMLAHLGVPLEPSKLQLVNDGQSNRSPVALAAFAANVIAEPAAAPPWLVDAATGAYEVQFGKGTTCRLWTREEYGSLLAYAAERNGRLAARLALVQPGFAINASAPPGNGQVFREDLTGEFWMRAARWTFAGARRAGAG